MKRIVYILGLIFIFFGCKSAQPTPEQLAVKQKISYQIGSKDYSVKFDQAVPMRGRNVILTSDYSVTVKNDSVFAYLPYYGRVSYSRYGGDSGIKFKEPYQNYTWNPTSKNDGYEISMEVREPDYQWRLFLTIFDNGRSTLSVSSPQRDAITFYGEVELQK